MKTSRILMLLLLVVLGFSACKKDEKTTLEISSIFAGTMDIYGATSATDVPVANDIVVTFSADIDPNTATQSSVSLKRGTIAEALTVTGSGKTVTINPTKSLQGGTSYSLTISGILTTDGEEFPSTTISFTTDGIGLGTVPQSGSQIMYLSLSGNIDDATGNATKVFERVSYTTDRFGATDGAAYFRGATAAGDGDIVELSGSQFLSPSMTISLWFKINPADYTKPNINKPMLGICAEKGYFIEMGDGETGPAWLKAATNHKVDPDPKSVGYATAWGEGAPVADLLLDTAWHQLVITYDAVTSSKKMFIDGIMLKEWVLLAATEADLNLKDLMFDGNATGMDKKLTLGYFCSRSNKATGWATFANATNSFKGGLDDIRIWNKMLTETEVNTLYNAEK